MKKLRYMLWGLVAIAFIGFIALNLPQKSDASHTTSFEPIAGFNQGQHFTLTSHLGKPFNSNDEINEGDYALLFFGFTHCPVICPTELQKFATVIDKLPEDIAPKVTPIFITIDPERDTVESLKNYVTAFHENIIGLTGKIEDVHNVLDAWKVFYTKVNDPQFSEYTMDHSTYSYLVNHDMQIVALFRMKATADEISDRISKIAATNK